jgi:DNA-binding MarR family transcriptional regulator
VIRNQPADEELLPLLEVLEEFNSHRSGLRVQVLATYLYIAANGPVPMPDLQRDLKMSSASASRNTDLLADWDWRGNPGPNLIKKEPDPLMATRAILSLTARGERLALSIKRILYGT